MRYIFIVQGEGRGHLTQAITLSKMLRKHNHEVAEVLVGRSSNREIPKYFYDKIGTRVRLFDSPSLDYGKEGKRGKIAKSVILNSSPKRMLKWRKSISLIARRVNKSGADAIINLYEPLLGVAKIVHRIDAPIVAIAHQFLIEHPLYPHKSLSDYNQFALKQNNILCSMGATKTIALSFYKLKDYYRDRIAVLPPLLREELFNITPSDENFMLGYTLNHAYMDEIISYHKKNPKQVLHIFWDKKNAPKSIEVDKTMTIHTIDDSLFLELMGKCSGYVTTAGFESICEALYLGKPTLMIPAHIEQQINAIDAKEIGAGEICKKFDLSKLSETVENYNTNGEEFREWVDSAEDLFIRHLTTLV